PIYGERDVVDLAAMRELGLPFWLAGSYGSPDQLADARAQGAAGVQMGTAFAFCDESGLTADLKRRVIEKSREGKLDVFTDPSASPAGFPFKVLQIEDTLADDQLYAERQRVCDLGYLRQAYQKEDGKVGWRCSAEPVDQYLAKGGTLEDTAGRKCICNGLFSNIGLAQWRDGDLEKRLVTCGNDVNQIVQFLPSTDATSYSARDVIRRVLQLAEPAAKQFAAL
ncbi:MAG: hypothetical protein KDA61_18535, partial [Planctomycetales bacterium]|nr:hypothetical protein [Planctomycetales bacterium]